MYQIKVVLISSFCSVKKFLINYPNISKQFIYFRLTIKKFLINFNPNVLFLFSIFEQQL